MQQSGRYEPLDNFDAGARSMPASALAPLTAALWIVPNELLLGGTIIVLALLCPALRFQR